MTPSSTEGWHDEGCRAHREILRSKGSASRSGRLGGTRPDTKCDGRWQTEVASLALKQGGVNSAETDKRPPHSAESRRPLSLRLLRAGRRKNLSFSLNPKLSCVESGEAEARLHLRNQSPVLDKIVADIEVSWLSA